MPLVSMVTAISTPFGMTRSCLIALSMQATGSKEAQDMKKHLVDVSGADEGDVELHLDEWATA
jgi:hypothetical protein